MCMSPMIESVLRTEMDFKARPENYVVSDSGALDFMVSQFHRFNASVDAAIAAMHAGVDLNSGLVFLELRDAAAAGAVAEPEIDRALTRLFHARMSLGLFDPFEATVYSNLTDADVMSAAHRAESLAMARRSLVLLRNERALLPLSERTVPRKRIAVVGWGANDSYAPLGNYMGCGHDAWGPRLANCSVITPLEGIRAQFEPQGFTVSYTRGCDPESNSTDGFAEAVVAAKAADVVIFVGGNRNCEGGQGVGGAHCESEGHDRPDLAMPGVQTTLLKVLHAANPNIVMAVRFISHFHGLSL